MLTKAHYRRVVTVKQNRRQQTAQPEAEGWARVLSVGAVLKIEVSLDSLSAVSIFWADCASSAICDLLMRWGALLIAEPVEQNVVLFW